MRVRNCVKQTAVALQIGAIMLIAGAGLAEAGGFSGGSTTSGLAHATSDAWTVAVSDGYLDRSSHTYAYTAADGGPHPEAYAAAGNVANGYVRDDAHYDQTHSAKAKTYIKGEGVMAKARSATYTTIVIDGHTYFVAEEVAKAMSRFTPFDVTALAISDVTASGGSSSGFIGVNTGTRNEGTVRIQGQ